MKEHNGDIVQSLSDAFKKETLLSQLMILAKYKHKLSNDALSEVFLIHRSTVFRRYRKTYKRMRRLLMEKGGKNE